MGKREECIEFIKRNIPDPHVRTFLFGGAEKDEDDFLGQSKTIVDYYNNLLLLAFGFVYGRYRQWKTFDDEVDSHISRDVANNLYRVVDSLYKLYRVNNLTYELIESVLLDIQIDIAINGHLMKELRIQGDIAQNHDFAKFAYKAKKARASSRFLDNVSINDRLDELLNFIRMFPFLRYISFTFEPIGAEYGFASGAFAEQKGTELVGIKYQNDFVKQDFPDEFSLNGLFVSRFKRQYFFLESTEFIKDSDTGAERVLLLHYGRVGDIYSALKVHVANDEALATASVAIPGDQVLVVFDTAFDEYRYRIFGSVENINIKDALAGIKDFYAINYKYIRNLALAISDILTGRDKETLLYEYENKYASIFDKKRAELNHDNSYNWDTVMAMLLIEEGASNVLKMLFDRNGDLFSKLAKNIEHRFGGHRVNAHAIQEISERLEKQSIEEFKLTHFGAENAVGGMDRNLQSEYGNIRNEVRARIVITEVYKLINGNEAMSTEVSFPISIRSRIKLLRELAVAPIPLQDRIGHVRMVLNQTLKSLLGFYDGFFAYAAEKREFENESYYNALSVEAIRMHQDDADRAFNAKLQNTYRRLSEYGPEATDKLIEEVLELCAASANPRQNDNRHELIKQMLGKSYLMDMTELTPLTGCFDHIKTDENLREVTDRIIRFLEYIQTGRSRKYSTSVGTIFPYIATYEYTNTTRDGYSIAHFSVISESGEQKDIRVLSEFTYVLNEKYFCLPNLLRANEKLGLWIEPIVINYKQLVEEVGKV